MEMENSIFSHILKTPDDMIFVNCFYYSFYIKRSELWYKYNLTEKDIQNSEEQSKNLNINSNNFSNILSYYKNPKILEKRVWYNIMKKIFSFLKFK